jgi:hypothetical protein
VKFPDQAKQLRVWRKKKWVVYAKKPFGSPKKVPRQARVDIPGALRRAPNGKSKVSRRPNLPHSEDGFFEFDAQAWDRQIEEDVREGRLDKLADEALAAHRAGKSKGFETFCRRLASSSVM